MSSELKETLEKLYKDLNYPSVDVFLRAIKKKGIAARRSDVEEFVKSRSERQILAPPPKYEGNIVSSDINDRWAADLISYVSQPATFKKVEYKYVLTVQDLFSRRLYARALTTVDQATRAFEEILDEAGGSPLRLTFDGAPEFSSTWKAMLSRRGILEDVKRPEDKQAIATLDAAIANLKKALKRREAAGGGNWASELQQAVQGLNSSSRPALGGMAPEDVEGDGAVAKDLRFSLKQEASDDLQENQELVAKRQEKLKEAGAFRVFQEPRGPRRRADKPTWSTKVHIIDSFPAPGEVTDKDGDTYLTKLTLPVPLDAKDVELSKYGERGSAQVDTKRKRALATYADRLKNFVKDDSPLASVSKKMKREVEGFRDELKKQKTSFRQFVELFPDVVTIRDGRLTLVGQRQGALDQYAPRQRPRWRDGVLNG